MSALLTSLTTVGTQIFSTIGNICTTIVGSVKEFSQIGLQFLG